MADIYWTDYLEKLIYLEQAVGHKTHYTILEPFQVERTVIGLQAAARTIADFIGLNEYMFVVAVVNLDGKAAHIELTRSGREVFIEISEHLMSVSGPGVLAALSHEICHKYLHHHGLDISEMHRAYENEVLTDLCAVFLGLGKLILNGCKFRTTHHTSNSVESTTFDIGYLSRKQLAAVYNLVCAMRNISRSVAEGNLTRDALKDVRDMRDIYREFYDNAFHNADFIEEIIDAYKGYVDRAQGILAEIGFLVERIEREIVKPAQLFVNRSHRAIFDESKKLLSRRETVYDPALRYLKNLEGHLHFASAIEALQAVHRESNEKRQALVQLINDCRMSPHNTACAEGMGSVSTVRCPIDGFSIEISSQDEAVCPSCGYVFRLFNQS
ncbi:MAG: hypothetical protein ACOX20_03805 [Limnochordia bacterium]